MSEPPYGPPYRPSQPPYPQHQPQPGPPRQVVRPPQPYPPQSYQPQSYPQQRRPDIETTSQVRAAMAARSELGPEYDDAIAALKQAIEIKPNSEQAMMGLAMSFISKGDRDSARALLPRLKELDESLASILEKSLAK
jgi:tetratricopeptide (TPR) repeat protein